MWRIFAAFMLIGAVAGRVTRPYDTARMREVVEQQCKMYGAEKHTEKVMKDMLTFMDCASNITDKEGLARLKRAQNEDVPIEIISFVKTTCKSQNEINTCFSNVIDAFSPCTDPKLRDKVDDAKKSLVEMTDLFCKDNSKSFSEFINDGAFSCMEQNLYSIMACFSKIETLQTHKTLTNAEACDKAHELTNCIVGTLEYCPKPSTVTFVKAVFKAAYKGSLCTAANYEIEEGKIANNAI